MVVVAGRQELTAQTLAHWSEGRSVVLVGDAGMGKSTVLHSIAAAVAQHPGMSLAASPAEADTRMPFVTLIDLFAGVPAEHFERLPAPTRRIVDLALRRRDPAGRGMDTLAVCLGMLDLLRSITEAAPATLVLDDLQWIDQASAEVLAFVARRLAPGRLTVLAALRAGESPRLHPPGAVTLEVGPLPTEVLVPVVMARADGLVGRPVAHEICALSGGNPLLALEIAEAVRRGGVPPVTGEPLPVPIHLETLMRQRLAALPPTARDTVRLAATAHRPTLALLVRAGCTEAVADLTAASEAGVCDLDRRGNVTFGHPLLRAAVYADAPVLVRMALHARLVEATDDPIDRARHLAMATGLEDETVARALTDAAEIAGSRGAAGVARELSCLAALRTPVTNQAGWARRKLDEARHAHRAGLLSETREAAEAVLAADVPAQLRVRAWLVIFEANGVAIGQMGEQVAAALADAGSDAELEPWVRLYSAIHHGAALRPELALVEARLAARAAVAVGDTRAEARALHVLLAVKARLGRGHAEETTRISQLLSQDADIGEAANLIYYELGSSYFDSDRYDEAVDVLHRAVRRAEESGTFGGVEWVLHLLARVDWRRGRCASALATVARFQQLAIDIEPISGHLVRWAAAEAEAVTGELPRAVEIAEQVIAETERVGDTEQLAQYCHFLGVWRLLLGDATKAVAALERALAFAAPFATTNQTRVLLADLVEALVVAGDLAQARARLSQLRDVDQGASAIAVAARQRATAALTFAEGCADAAVALLTSAAETYRTLGTPIELARVLLTAAGIERRRRRRAAARTLLDEAATACRTAGATVWVDRVEAELVRFTPAPRDYAAQLTPMQERIAAMVVQGATNREIASALAIGVTTVEGSLTQIYRRFRIRSRVDLVRTFTVSG